MGETRRQFGPGPNLNDCARVAEQADAEGLNPSGRKRPCGFEPHPGHGCYDAKVLVKAF